ncbi:hypothetical protein K1F50_14420 [Muricauda oceani]|uniref:Uncharacterized protein n=1 Tax=Flagellimonas oceani TaxID=2698672 RepID=A0A6G7J2I0_9FLAO|nr:hypothetical protein [Allomuricauda oceani]MBW8243999.1 hypothetical protein [Allomuricauda oceani]QII44976.1 hypothetical protein GVT53_09880 [Allomuricauda oceani]
MHNSFIEQSTKTVEVFSTSVTSIEKGEFLLDRLQKEFPYYEINFDLEDCDNILRVENVGGNLDSARIISFMEKYGEKIRIL